MKKGHYYQITTYDAFYAKAECVNIGRTISGVHVEYMSGGKLKADFVSWRNIERCVELI